MWRVMPETARGDSNRRPAGLHALLDEPIFPLGRVAQGSWVHAAENIPPSVPLLRTCKRGTKNL